MLNKIIEFAVKRKLIVGLFILGLIGFGSYEVSKLPIDAVPDITDNQVQVITIAPSFGATDIERLVTFPIEQANSNIAGLKEIRSFSRFGLSLVTIVFDDATDVYWARQQVAERLQQVQHQIPEGIGTPELGPITTGLGEIYQYVLRPKKGYEQKYDAIELRSIQDWIVRRQLLGVKGVAEVSSFGGKLKQFSVEITPSELLAHNITITDVFNALKNNNQNTGGAYIEKGPTVLYIRTEGLIGNIKDIENILIKVQDGGMPLYVRDVAQVKIGYATRYGALCYNDEGEVAGAIVMMLKGANSSEVVTDVKARIAQIQKTLPEGVVIEPFLDRSKMVGHAISTIEKNLLEGALIVIFVLVLFLGNVRAGLLVASVIPLAMLFAIIMMNIFGVSGNLMSLGALDFGLIVDGAVIIVEAVMHKLSHNKAFQNANRLNQAQMDETVQRSAGKMMNSAVFGQIIILIVYLPIFSLQGIEGKMFKPMAQTVAFALIGAFILSLTYIPMMSALVLSKTGNKGRNFSDRIMERIATSYQRALNRVIAFPKAVLIGTLALFVFAMVVLSSMGGEFIPTLEEGDFAVEARVLPGSSLATTIDVTQQAAHILKSRFPEVIKVVTKIGSGEVPTDPMPMEASDMMVILKDKKEWISAKTFPDLADTMGKALQDVPGLTTSFQYPVQMRFNELMTGAKQDVVCKIFGENLDTLARYASILAQISNTVKGTNEMYVESVSGMPQITIKYNRNMLSQYGLNITDVNTSINTALAGQTAGMVFEGERRFELVLRLSGEKRKSLSDIQNLLIPISGDRQIPLYQLADVAIEDGPNQIQREDAKRRIIVGFNVKGRDVQSIVHDLQAKVATELHLPAGYYVTYGGAFENLNAAKQRLMVAVPLSLLLIFLLLYFAFHSLRQGLLIYSAIPLSAIGGILFLALRGMPFSISAGVGFIALFGVAVLNGIVLIAEFNRIREDGEQDIKEIVLQGTKMRLRPVLMTAFVASLGFLPMAMSNGAGAEVQRPLATVVIGGLLIATFLTLFVLPILYMTFEKGKSKMNTISAKAILPILLISSAGITQAQTPISLQAAIDTALKNNFSVKEEVLKAKYLQLLVGTGNNLPATSFVAEVGKFNSDYNDTKFAITQSFSLPVVYKRQTNLLKQAAQSSFLNIALAENELKGAVTRAYYHIVLLNRKEQLLQSTDSMYAAFLQRATLRLKTGESNVLEQATAQAQLAQISNELASLKTDREIMLIQFQLLLNATEERIPDAADLKMPAAYSINDETFSQHPYLVRMEQDQKVAAAAISLERAKLLPEFSLGLNNTSIRGLDANGGFNTEADRFNSVQAGIAIPLLGGAQRARVAGAKNNEIIAAIKYRAGVQALKAQYQMAWLEYKKLSESVFSLEKNSLPSAATIKKVANQQLFAGDINYLEWVMLINQSVAIQNQYLDILNQLNEANLKLQYLNFQNK